MTKRAHRRRTEPQSIAALVASVYPSREPEDAFAVRAFGWWARAVPARVAKNARPVSFARGVLLVHATTSAWASDLSFLKVQLLESLKRHVPDAGVKDLVVRVGPLPKVPPHARKEKPPPDVEPVAASALPEPLARALAGIGDDGVREAVSAAARVAIARDEAEAARRTARKRPR